jgi:hypothetical protein
MSVAAHGSVPRRSYDPIVESMSLGVRDCTGERWKCETPLGSAAIAYCCNPTSAPRIDLQHPNARSAIDAAERSTRQAISAPRLHRRAPPGHGWLVGQHLPCVYCSCLHTNLPRLADAQAPARRLLLTLFCARQAATLSPDLCSIVSVNLRPSGTNVPELIGMLRGFKASGSSRFKSITRSPSPIVASVTST